MSVLHLLPNKYILFSLLFVAAFTLAACSTTSRIVTLDEGNELNSLTANVDTESLRGRYGNADGVYIRYHETLEHNVNIAFTSTIPQWKFFRVVDQSRVVYNPLNQELNRFTVELPPKSRITKAYLSIRSPNATAAVFDEGDLVKQKGPNGEMTYTMSYPSVEAGSIIEERYEIAFGDLQKNPPVHHFIPLQMDYPVEDLSFQYIYPMWWQVQVKRISNDQSLNYSRREDSDSRKVTLEYAAQNVPAFTEGADGPYFKQVAPYFELMVTSLSMGSAMRYRAPTDWSSFAEQYARYQEPPKFRDVRRFRNEADQITSMGAGSDMEKVERVLQFVSNEIALNPMSKPTPFADVLAKKEGNAYGVTALAQALLEHAGVNANFVLVHPARAGFFDPEFYSPDQLSEPALTLPVNGEEVVVLPGRQVSLQEQLPMALQGQTALLLSEEEGFAGFTELTGMPMMASNSRMASPQAQPVVVPAQQQSSPAAGTPVEVEIAPPAQEVSEIVQDQAGNQPQPVQQPEMVVTQPETTSPPVNTETTQQPVRDEMMPPVMEVVQPRTRPVPTPPREMPTVSEVTTQTPVTEQTQPAIQPQPAVQQPVAEPQSPAWRGSINRQLGGWTWIVSSSTTIEEAEMIANEYARNLFANGTSIDLLSGNANGVTRYRIAVGQYPSRSMAEREQTRLGDYLPPDAWLLQITPDM